MFDAIKNSRFQVRWNLREFHLVTQWKDGCVYHTRSLGMVVCSPEYADYIRINHPNVIVGPVSTRVSKLIG